ncbi:pyrroloquinoline quinone (PQQ) biosynthesis protein C [Catenibacillus scindens]|uniref:Pyrroloquinoline quinone (PQQ) biosynthesis protein C n=1 Tax=Catenibacillus scindens TaxID=673271 RepID=A0A7W8HB78_9FIRM|nr:hypothetical protein [Catenibacillus scindens]MBB5265168.1 pyrroloquinoline quinone (PQQ) biosynthesis protein C [Catenibacillus scindens]
MGTSSKANHSSVFGAGASGNRKKGTEQKKDWTFWFIVGVIVVFAVVVVCVYFVKRYNALDRTYIKVGDHEVTKVEFDYYYNTITNNFLSQNSDSLLFMGLDTSSPLDEQAYIYDSNMTWADYFTQNAVSAIQTVKALNDDAAAQGFEYDVTSDYDTYMSAIDSTISSQGVSASYYYEHAFGEFATEKRIEPFVKEYLTYEAYYNQLIEDNAATDEEVQEAYEADPESYDTIDYRLYSMPADVEDDATDEEREAALDEVEERANEMADRFSDGEDWRELCYEYARESAKDSYDPENESDPTVVTGGTSATISSNYFDWLSDDSRQANDIMVYRDESNDACFIVVFDSKTPYDLETDSSDIAGTLATERVTEYINGLLGDYEVIDDGHHLNYLYINDETDTSDTADTEETADSKETSDTQNQTVDSSASETEETETLVESE